MIPPIVMLKYSQIMSDLSIVDGCPLALIVGKRLVYLWVYVVHRLITRNSNDKILPRIVIFVVGALCLDCVLDFDSTVSDNDPVRTSLLFLSDPLCRCLAAPAVDAI